MTPQQIISNLLNTNPQARAILQQAKNSNMTLEQFARQLAKQKGVNIDEMYQYYTQLFGSKSR